MSNPRMSCPECKSEHIHLRKLGGYRCRSCMIIFGSGPREARAGVSCAALVGASDSASGVEDKDLHSRIEEAIQEAQYCYVIADKASEARWLERAVGMIGRRLRIVGTNDMEQIAPTTRSELSRPAQDSENQERPTGRD